MINMEDIGQTIVTSRAFTDQRSKSSRGKVGKGESTGALHERDTQKYLPFKIVHWKRHFYQCEVGTRRALSAGGELVGVGKLSGRQCYVPTHCQVESGFQAPSPLENPA